MFGQSEKSPLAQAGKAEPMSNVSMSGKRADGKAAAGTSPAEAADTGQPSIIGPNLKVVGNLQSNGELQVDGTVEGDIDSRTLIVGESAQITGSVTAETVRISGSVSGHVKATAVKIAKTARVAGDVTYRTLSVEEGARLDGNCRRIDSEKAAAMPPLAEAKIAPLKPA